MEEPENGTVVAVRWQSGAGFKYVSVYWRDDEKRLDGGVWWVAGDERYSSWEEVISYAVDIQVLGVVKSND